MIAPRVCLCAALALGAFVGQSRADSPLIFNTGTDSNNAAAPDGSIESHYVVNPGGPGIVDNSLSATPAADSISGWIRPNTNLGSGSYQYLTTFTMTSADPITINGRWAAYASGLQILLNGFNSNQSTPDPGYTDWHDFSVSGTALVGANTLDFRVGEAFSDGFQPTGLRVEIISILPEPSCLMLTSFAGMVLLSGRRRRMSHG